MTSQEQKRDQADKRRTDEKTVTLKKELQELRYLTIWVKDYAPEDVEKLQGYEAATLFVRTKMWVNWLQEQKRAAEKWLEEKQTKIADLRSKFEALEKDSIQRLDAANKERLAFHAMLVECLPELPVELHERARIVLGLSKQDAPKGIGANEAFRDAFGNARDHLSAEGDRLEKAKVYAGMMSAIAQKQLAEALERYLQKAGGLTELAGAQMTKALEKLAEETL